MSTLARQADLVSQNHALQRAVAARLDALPTTLLHMLAVALCAAGFTFDLLEMALGSALSAVFSVPPHTASPHELSWLLASVYIGASIGAPLLGWMADRHGRRRVLAGALLWLGLFSLCAAANQRTAELTFFRGMSGVALGAYPPLMITYLTDLLPPRRRGMLILVTVALAALGPIGGIFLIRWLTPLQPLGIEAWRWGFVVGGAGALVVGTLFRILPESPRWLASHGHAACAWQALARFERSRPLTPLNEDPTALAPVRENRIPVVSTPNPSVHIRLWPLLGLLFLLSPWATVAFPLLTGAVLTQKGFKLSDTLLYVGLSTFGPLVGTLLSARAADRIERRLALISCAAAMAITGWFFVEAHGPVWLAVSSIAFNIFSSLYVALLNVYSAELFPTKARALSISAAWSLNRIGAMAAPFLLIPLLHSGGAASMFGVIAATLALSALLLFSAPKGRQLQTLP